MINIDVTKEKNNKPLALGLGFFDCLHLGHRKILSEVKAFGKNEGVLTSLFTFSNNFRSLLGEDRGLIYTFEERTKLFEEEEIDLLLYASFDKDFMNLSAYEFLSLLNRFDIKFICCGEDYTFGRDIKGVNELSSYCKEKDIKLCVIKEVKHNGIRVSSSLIKQLIKSNEIERANALLGRPFSLSGKVVKGRGAGKEMSFPTANLEISAEKVLPEGVFVANTLINGKMYNTITSIGSIPTFNIEAIAVEAHVLGFEGDLYGKTLTLWLKEYLRPIKRFDSAERLKEQMQKDKEYAGKIRP